MTRRNRTVRHLAWCAAAVLLLTMLGAAEAIVGHGLVLIALVVLLPVAAFLAGRWHGLRQLRERSRYLPDRMAEELAWYRRSLAELEEAAGRPLSAIIASYRRVQSRYQAPGDRP
jgi:hypothetical protein